MMKSSYLSLAAGLLLPLLAAGQSRDHVVVVSNAYEASVGAVQKPLQTMSVPDSLLRFDLDYDYSVIENPYKGSYEFQPQLVHVTPAAEWPDDHNLLLSLGAGYSLHPELELAWTGKGGESLSYGVRARHQSYFGQWQRIGTREKGEKLYLKKNGETWSGYDMTSGAEATVRYDAENQILSARLFADHIGYRDEHAVRPDPIRDQFFSGGASFRVRSRQEDVPFFYDAQASYRFSSNQLNRGDAFSADPSRREHYISLDGHFGAPLGDARLMVDVDVDIANQRGGDFNGMGGLMAFTPRYLFDRDRWHFSLGARFETKIAHENYPTKSAFPLYPAARVRYDLIPGLLDVYALATGGGQLHPYFEQVAANHFCNSSILLTDAFLGSMDASFTQADLSLGLRGRMDGRLQYDLRGGYSRETNGLLDGVALGGIYDCSMISFVDYNRLYAEAMADWTSDRLSVDGLLRYTWTDAASDVLPIFAPAAFRGNLAAQYRFNERFQAGASLEWSSRRKTGTYGAYSALVLPGWIDLGLQAAYRLNDRLTLWARGGNLLFGVQQRNALYAQQGGFATIGLRFVL